MIATIVWPRILKDKNGRRFRNEAEVIALNQAESADQAKAFEKLKSAKVVIIPNANHYMFQSNEQEVEKDVKDFLGRLNQKGN